jgi:hypothetical protein
LQQWCGKGWRAGFRAPAAAFKPPMKTPGRLPKIFVKFGSKPIAGFKLALKILLHGEGQVRDNPGISVQR